MAEDRGNFVGDLRTQFQGFFDSLSMGRRILLFGVLGSVILGMVLLIYVANRESWTPLYSNISNEDAGVIKEKLDQNQIPVLVGPGGRSLLVPSNMADEARIALAQEHVPTLPTPA